MIKKNEALKNQSFMDDMYIVFLYQGKADNYKKVAYKHRVKLTLELLNQIREIFNLRTNS